MRGVSTLTTRERIERGDWQTPAALADAVLDRVNASCRRRWKTVIEPTCGQGTLLVAAAKRFPQASLRGFDINDAYAASARRLLQALAPARARVSVADFFTTDWAEQVADLEAPILVLGNPPWVTSAQLGAISSTNLPGKENRGRHIGLDAITGKSNFDVSEWMIVRLLEALEGRDATLAMLCKSAVARRVVETVAARKLGVTPVGLWRIDAAQHFDASVSAVLLVAQTSRREARVSRRRAVWPVYSDLAAERRESSIGVVEGVMVADAQRFARTKHLAGTSDPEWRSGVKHDCARIMELVRVAGSRGSGTRWVNGLDEHVDIEEELIHPLLKSSDVANDRAASSRGMIVTQRTLGADTRELRRSAPRAWKYLSRHRALLEARKSSIYDRQPPFAIFGVGPYSFAPWKVAVSGLYKRSTFTVVGPHEGRPVLLDDTCYFLAFDDEVRARRAHNVLGSAVALDFLTARIFWDAKRPITKSILQTLDLAALERELGVASDLQSQRRWHSPRRSSRSP